MKTIKVERTLFVLGILSAALSLGIHIKDGWQAWSWQLACIFWILTCWMKAEMAESIKNQNQ
jgi:hypothetical protein